MDRMIKPIPKQAVPTTPTTTSVIGHLLDFTTIPRRLIIEEPSSRRKKRARRDSTPGSRIRMEYCHRRGITIHYSLIIRILVNLIKTNTCPTFLVLRRGRRGLVTDWYC